MSPLVPQSPCGDLHEPPQNPVKRKGWSAFLRKNGFWQRGPRYASRREYRISLEICDRPIGHMGLNGFAV